MIRPFVAVTALSLCCASLAMAQGARIGGPSNVNVRAAPSEHARVIRSLSPDTQVEILQQRQEFTQIQLQDGQLGWVLHRMLLVAPPAAQTPPVQVPVAPPTQPVAAPQAGQAAEAMRHLERRVAELQAQGYRDRAVAGGSGLLLGVLAGALGLQAYYRKRLNGLRI